MSAVRDQWSGRTLGSADRRWHEIEHDLTLLDNRKKRFYEFAEKHHLHRLNWDWSEVDDWNEQIRRLTDEQSHLEMFLIENEAPGWTST